MNEDSDPVKKRKIVKRFLMQLTRDEPQMYYATTSEVARSIHLMIKEHTNRLSVEEQALVRKMSIDDIKVMLGFALK